MNRQSIIEKVKVKLDELTPLSEGLEHPIDRYIDPLLDDAARIVTERLPIQLFRMDGVTNAAKTFESPRVTLEIPDTVARIYNVKLSDWSNAVEPVEEHSDTGREQSDKYLRGGVRKPVAVLRNDQTKRYLDCYSGTNTSTHTINAVLYKKPEQMHESMIIPLVLQCAKMVAEALGRGEALAVLDKELSLYDDSIQRGHPEV